MSYSQRLTQGGSFLTRLAHRSRYQRTLDHLGRQFYERALDFGCGDGLLLRQAYDRGLIRSGIGIDNSEEMRQACQQLFAGIPEFRFESPDSLPDLVAPRSCDLAICTETLEHVPSFESTIELILQFCQSGARLIISVPIEVGPSLVCKQIGRFLANRKGQYGHEKYSWRELSAAVLMWDVDRFPSTHNSAALHKGHKGFDYRKVASFLRHKVSIEKTMYTPFPICRAWLNSTVFWVCRVP